MQFLTVTLILFVIKENKKMGLNKTGNKPVSNNPVKRSKFDPAKTKVANLCNVKIDWLTFTGVFLERIARKSLLSAGWVITKQHKRNALCYELQRTISNKGNHRRIIETKARIYKNSYKNSWSISTSNNLNKKEKKKVIDALSYMNDDCHISRIDVAFDFINFDNVQMSYRFYKTGTKTTVIQDRKGLIETIYCGSSESKVQYRYYDKAKEQKKRKKEIPANYNKWERLELTTRNPIEYLERDVDRMLHSFKKPKAIKGNLTGIQTIVLYAVSEHPELLNLIQSKTTKRKYLSYLDAYQGYDSQWADLARESFRSNLAEIKKELESFTPSLEM